MPGSRAVFSPTELLGQLLQSGISSSTRGRLDHAMGLKKSCNHCRQAARVGRKRRSPGFRPERAQEAHGSRRADPQGAGDPLAVQLYAVSPLAIGMDTAAERRYLRRLAHGLRLEASVVLRVHQCLG